MSLSLPGVVEWQPGLAWPGLAATKLSHLYLAGPGKVGGGRREVATLLTERLVIQCYSVTVLHYATIFSELDLSNHLHLYYRPPVNQFCPAQE